MAGPAKFEVQLKPFRCLNVLISPSGKSAGWSGMDREEPAQGYILILEVVV